MAPTHTTREAVTKPSTKAAVLPREALALSHSPNCPSRPSKFKRSPTRAASTRERIIPREPPGLQAGAGDGQQAGQTAGRADEQGAQAQTSQDRILVVLLQAAFKKQAQESA